MKLFILCISLTAFSGLALAEQVIADSNEKPRDATRQSSFDTNPKGYKKPRTSNEVWREKLGYKAYQTYTVKKGDTLSGISKRLFGTYDYWPKIWETNQPITNPHLIEPGQKLQYLREDRQIASSLQRVIIRKPDAAVEGETRKERIKVSGMFRPYILVRDHGELPIGEVSGSFSPWKTLFHMDQIFVKIKDESAVEVGQNYSLIRKIRSLKEKGFLYELVAEGKLLWINDGVARIDITSQFEKIHRNDEVVAFVPTIDFKKAFVPERKILTKVLGGKINDRKILGEGEFVVLDKGTTDGIKEGQLFRVYRAGDDRTGFRDTVRPTYKATVQIIQSGDLASIGFILESIKSVFIGDTLISASAFNSNKTQKLIERSTVEIN